MNEIALIHGTFYGIMQKQPDSNERNQMIFRCLFTGIELDAETTEEHAIPRSIGGRIKTKTTISSAVNLLFGSKIDDHLTHKYRPIMISLGPQLPLSMRVGGLKAHGELSNDKYEIKGDLSLHRDGRLVIKRDPISS